MLLVLACDFNRRAQKMRWGFFGIGLLYTAYNATSRIFVQWSAEQISLISQLESSWIHQGAGRGGGSEGGCEGGGSHLQQFTAQDVLRIVDVALLLTMLTTFATIVRHPDVVIFVVHRFTRRQLPILRRLSFRRGMRRRRDRESLELSFKQHDSWCSVSSCSTALRAAPTLGREAQVPVLVGLNTP